MTELAIQADKLRNPSSDEDPEKQKQDAIALCRRRIEAAVILFGEGRLDKDEYRRRVELNEREIAHWEARTTQTEKAALELAICMDAIDKLARLWDMGDDEDRQGMARSLFSYIVYDLDTRRIVDFRLKSWADRFWCYVLHFMRTVKPQAEDVIPQGFEAISGASPQTAAQRLLQLLYPTSASEKPQKKDEITRDTRNEEIRRRYNAGERVVELAREYGMTIQAIYRILRIS